VLAFADASLWPHRLGSVTLLGLTLHGWVMTVVLHLRLGGGSFIIALARVHWVQRRGAARETRGGPWTWLSTTTWSALHSSCSDVLYSCGA
jgi:hypothetical protein